MNDETFATIINQEVIQKALSHYCDLVELPGDCPTGKPSKQKWTEVLETIRNLDPSTKRMLMIFVNQVSVDTAAHLLGILDGSSILDNHREEFRLYYGDGSIALNGDLQTYFLAEQEHIKPD